jgi:hypothetical protein
MQGAEPVESTLGNILILNARRQPAGNKLACSSRGNILAGKSRSSQGDALCRRGEFPTKRDLGIGIWLVTY